MGPSSYITCSLPSLPVIKSRWSVALDNRYLRWRPLKLYLLELLVCIAGSIPAKKVVPKWNYCKLLAYFCSYSLPKKLCWFSFLYIVWTHIHSQCSGNAPVRLGVAPPFILIRPWRSEENVWTIWTSVWTSWSAVYWTGWTHFLDNLDKLLWPSEQWFGQSDRVVWTMWINCLDHVNRLLGLVEQCVWTIWTRCFGHLNIHDLHKTSTKPPPNRSKLFERQ